MSGPVDTLEATDAPPRPPAIEPRLWQRRVAVLRAQGRRRLRWVVAAVIAVVLVAVLLVLLHSPVLALRHVWVRGALHTGAATVVDAAGLRGAPPLVDVDTGATAARVERLPWVAHAVVTRDWPDGVTVTVTERVPAAVMSRPAGQFVLVDGTGHVLAWTRQPPVGIPALVAPTVPGPGGTVLAPPARPGLAVADALPGALVPRVERVVVVPGGHVWLDLGRRVSVALGAARGLPAKFEALVSLLAAAPPSAGAVIDVRVPDQPTVGPRSPGAPPWR